MNHPIDPRKTITPDAFAVADELLGMPLAGPWRRGLAMLIDLLLVALLANASGVFLGLAAAIVLFRVAFGRGAGEPKRGFIRTTVGLAAALVLFVTVVSAWDAVFDRGPEGPDRIEPGTGHELTLGGLGATVGELVAFRNADDPAGAEAALEAFGRRLERSGVPPEEMAEALYGIAEMRDDPWVAEAVERALADLAAGRRAAATASRQPTDSLVLSYADALRAGDTLRVSELRPHVVDGLAGERLDHLARRIERLEQANGRLRDELERAREGPGPLRLMANAADELGIGFGWMGLYFTFFLAFWDGRTPGKRLMRIRVLRLDGRPITWWVALNRFGGYAASVFTGLLGFAEMFWDDNRQALQDRIAHTVVIRD